MSQTCRRGLFTLIRSFISLCLLSVSPWCPLSQTQWLNLLIYFMMNQWHFLKSCYYLLNTHFLQTQHTKKGNKCLVDYFFVVTTLLGEHALEGWAAQQSTFCAHKTFAKYSLPVPISLRFISFWFLQCYLVSLFDRPAHFPHEVPLPMTASSTMFMHFNVPLPVM